MTGNDLHTYSWTEEQFIRLNMILKIYPVSKSTWWAGVKSGRFPQPVKLGARTTAWKMSEIIKLIESVSQKPTSPSTP